MLHAAGYRQAFPHWPPAHICPTQLCRWQPSFSKLVSLPPQGLWVAVPVRGIRLREDKLYGDASVVSQQVLGPRSTRCAAPLLRFTRAACGCDQYYEADLVFLAALRFLAGGDM